VDASELRGPKNAWLSQSQDITVDFEPELGVVVGDESLYQVTYSHALHMRIQIAQTLQGLRVAR